MKFTTGQSLIEVLIAFAITVIIGVGLISANLVTQRASTSARNNTQATKLAQEYVEKIRLFRDVNGYAQLPTTTNGCHKLSDHENDDVSTWSIVGTGAFIPCTGELKDGEVVKLPEFKSVFYRDFQITGYSATQMTVLVNVSWTEGINTKVVTVETKLTNWLSI